MSALAEIERAIQLDPFDAETINLKAAWCLTLRLYEDAVSAANEAIRLRPEGYAKPFINKSLALHKLGRDKDAFEAAQAALTAANKSADSLDKKQAEEIIAHHGCLDHAPRLSDFKPMFERLIIGSQRIAEKEAGEHEADPQTIVLGFFNRARKLAHLKSIKCVPIVAELLSDFPAERVFSVFREIPSVPNLLAEHVPKGVQANTEHYSQLAMKILPHSMNATAYIAATADGIMQRDAARVLCLVLLSMLDEQRIRALYREVVLEPSAVRHGPLRELDRRIRNELARIDPILPELIALQEPVGDEGKRRASRTILLQLRKSWLDRFQVRVIRAFGKRR